MTAHRIGWLWSAAVVAVLLAIGAVVYAVPSDVQVPNAGMPEHLMIDGWAD